VPQIPTPDEMHFDKVAIKFVFTIIVVAVLLGTTSAQSASVPTVSARTLTTGGAPGSIRAGHILVRFKANASQAVLDGLNTAYGAKIVGKIGALGITHLQVSPEVGLALLGHLRNRSDVEFAEFDSPVQAIQTFVPDDTYYSTAYASSHYGNVAQWAPPAVSAPAAWGVSIGDSNTVIAIVDTGVDDTHPDLASKIVGEYSYVGRSAKDGFGHGTHCAGIAAAATNNNVGIAGMCPNCGILSVKVLDDQGSGYMSDVASGITYAASHGARVISLSLGGSGRSETLHSALDYAIANNALPVCAMGNNGSSSNTPEPGYWHDCLSVIATDQNGAKASFSNYGVKADVAAPGVAILSTMPTYPVTLTSTYGYRTNYDALSGTSMATPMIAGIAGLVLSENPSLTPTQVAGIIEASSGDGVSWNPNLAFGVINAYKAVSSAIHSDYVPPAAKLASPAEGATVSGLVTFQAGPTDNTTVHHVDFVQNGTRFMQVLTGASSSSGSGKNVVNTPAWTSFWPSTTVFNGPVTVSVSAVDVFGNSTAQNLDFTVQNKLVSQSWTTHLCWPGSGNCSSYTPWLPVTTGVATEAATHLQGTVTYSSQQGLKASDFWLSVASPNAMYYCGTNGTTVDCYPTVTLLPNGTKSLSNYSGAQIDGISQKGSGSEQGDVQWTLTYPQ
jgi:thermitase